MRPRTRPHWHWPDVSISAWRACLERIAQVVAGRLGPSASVTDLAIPAGADARVLGIAAYTSGAGPLLGRWLEDGVLDARDEVRAALAEQLDHARRRAARMHAALLAVLDTLHAAGIPVLVIKGAYTRTCYFPEPATRPAADIDIVVPRDATADVEHVLLGEGYERSVVSLHPYKCGWYAPHMPREFRSFDLDHAENPFTIEVHGSLERAFHGVRRVSFDADGCTEGWDVHPAAFRLVHPLHLIWLAAHASEELERVQLVRLVELVLVVRAEARTEQDWAVFLDRIEALDAHRFVYPALELTEGLVPGTVPEAVHSRMATAVPERMRRVLKRLTPGSAQRVNGVPLDERFMWARGPREIVLRALDLTLPSAVPGARRNSAALLLERIYRLVR